MKKSPMLLIEGNASAPVIVFANSLASSLRLWDGFVESLKNDYCLVRFNYAGHGDGYRIPNCYSVEEMSSRVLDALSDAGVVEFSVVGVSLGGMLALELASQAKEKVNRILVANSRYYQTSESAELWTKRMKLVRDEGIAPIVDPTVERWLSDSYKTANPKIVEQLETMIRQTSREGYISAAQCVRDFDGNTILSEIMCPTLLISGAHDMAAPAEHMQELAEKLGCKNFTLDASHIANVEKDKEFLEIMTKFLRDA